MNTRCCCLTLWTVYYFLQVFLLRVKKSFKNFVPFLGDAWTCRFELVRRQLFCWGPVYTQQVSFSVFLAPSSLQIGFKNRKIAKYFVRKVFRLILNASFHRSLILLQSFLHGCFWQRDFLLRFLQFWFLCRSSARPLLPIDFRRLLRAIRYCASGSTFVVRLLWLLIFPLCACHAPRKQNERIYGRFLPFRLSSNFGLNFALLIVLWRMSGNEHNNPDSGMEKYSGKCSQCFENISVPCLAWKVDRAHPKKNKLLLIARRHRETFSKNPFPNPTK